MSVDHSQQLRVAHVGNVGLSRSNGVHQVTTRLCRALPSVDVRAEVWHLSRSARLERDVVDGIEVWHVPVRAAPGAAGSHLQMPTPAAWRWLARRSDDVDVVHLHSVFQPDHIWATRWDRPYVLMPHGGYHPHALTKSAGLKRAWVAVVERRLLNVAASVQVLSDVEAQHVRALSPSARTRLLHAPMPPVAPQGPYAGSGPILFIGRLDPDHKGLDLLIEGFGRAAVRSSLHLYGPDHPGGREVLASTITSAGVEEQVRLHGPVSGDEKTDIITSASLFVHTSRREGLPLGPLEAMQYGVPVLVTPETNLGPLVERHQAGIVVDATPDAIAAGLTRFFERPAAERGEMGRRAAEAVRAHFSWETLGPAYRHMYEDAVGVTT